VWLNGPFQAWAAASPARLPDCLPNAAAHANGRNPNAVRAAGTGGAEDSSSEEEDLPAAQKRELKRVMKELKKSKTKKKP